MSFNFNDLSKRTKIIIGAVVGVLVVAGVIGGSIAIANAVKKNKQAKCEHIYDEGQITVEATCETDGVKLYTCSECDYELVEEILAHGHTEVEIEGVAASCTETGLTDGVSCLVCEKVLAQPMEVPALGHKPIEDATVAPTCTTSGKTAGSHCERCEIVLEKPETVPALSHNIVTVEGKVATCESTGLTAGSACGTCGKVYVAQEVIPVLSHKTEMIAGKAATCTESGLTNGLKCAVCNQTVQKQEVIPALGHTTQIIKGRTATCTQSGLTDGKECTTCKKVVLAQQTLPALGHSAVSQAAIPATCTETGMTAGSYCVSCGESLVTRTEIPALGHTVVNVPAVAPTCKETGLTAGSYCSVCDTVFATQAVIPATGHTIVEGSCVNCDYATHEATFTEVDVAAGEKVAGNWYRIYRKTSGYNMNGFNVSCKLDGIEGTNQVSNKDGSIRFAVYSTQAITTPENKNNFLFFPLSDGAIVAEGYDVYVMDEYIDIYLYEGMTFTWEYESAGTIVYDCEYTITADSVIDSIEEGVTVKRLVVNE